MNTETEPRAESIVDRARRILAEAQARDVGEATDADMARAHGDLQGTVAALLHLVETATAEPADVPISPRARWARNIVERHLIDQPGAMTQPLTLGLQHLDSLGLLLDPERAADIRAVGIAEGLALRAAIAPKTPPPLLPPKPVRSDLGAVIAGAAQTLPARREATR